MIGRADIEGLKSNIAMNAWLPQASYPCGNFSDTSIFEFRRSKETLGHAFTVRIRIGNQNQKSFYPSVPHKISVLVELILGHLRYLLTDVPPQTKSPPDNVFRPNRPAERALGPKRGAVPRFLARIGPQSEPWVQKEGQCPASDSRNNRIPLVRTSSELAVRPAGKAPEGIVPSPSPGRHAATRSRRGISSISPPTADGFGTGSPMPSAQSQSFSQTYGSILPTSLAYIVPSTRGCSPWRPDAVMNESNGEPTGQRPEHADAEARRRRAMPATIEETAFHERIESPGFSRPPIHAGPRPESIGVPVQALFDSLFKVIFIFPSRVIPPDLGSRSERVSAKGSLSPDARRAVASTAKRVELQPPLAAMSVDEDSHLGQPRARGAREASICPAMTARPVIEARCEGMTQCVTPRQTCPRPNGFGHNLRSKTRWFTGFCNSHQVSHFAMFFIDARAEISVAESRFCLQKKHRSPRRTPQMGSEGKAIDSSIPWRFPRRGRSPSKKLAAKGYLRIAS
ncbi:hypothetical protein CQW23_31301 [Capsicum baccatum]|uniref:Regulator of rDNA transcription protein 15 n=1 Tax=Capsicum baccatum TaxID=33114 RepID=A0A2G2V7X9_CAPBA|nr:hypothetical protein CQW23_31301 [Capsicum baccatum]